MNWLIENWFIIVAIIVALGCVVFAVYRFLGLPNYEQQTKVKEWLIWACIEAEKLLQSGTGQLKLREVWNLFCAVPAFTWIAKIISFETFSIWVSESLKTVKEMLVSNKTLAKYVYGDNADDEISKLKKQLECDLDK